MKAAQVKEVGSIENLKLAEVDKPSAGKGQVLIKVASAGVNFPDVLLCEGAYQFKPPPPFSPGGEIAGTIEEVGEGVEGFSVGDPVVALMIFGGFQEYIVAAAPTVFPLPKEVPLEQAGAFPLVYATSYYGLVDRAGLKAGETVVVLGAAGGVGLSSVELAKHLGARVIAVASDEEKLALCREKGADETINYKEENLKNRIRALTKGDGADVVVDPVGGSHSEQALRATAWGGRLLAIGFAAGDIPKIPLNLVLLKSCQLVGVFWGAFTAREPARHGEIMSELFKLWAEGKLKPEINTNYGLSQAQEALRELKERRVRGKISLVTGR